VDVWLRSLTLLGMGFVGVVVATLGIAALVVPGSSPSSQDGGTRSPGASGVATVPSPGGGIPGLGGTLTVTGDREGSLVLSRESNEGTYALVGSLGRIAFTGQPVEVTQLSYDGLEFFPDPGDCTITPGDLDNAIGIGFAQLSCIDIADIRDTGVISISGTIGMPVDRLVERELPATGGTLTIGDETWTFEYAYLYLWQQPVISGVVTANMELADVERGASLYFFYDIETHRTSVSGVMRDGETADIAAGACALQREELGRPNPRTTTVEIAIDCPSVEVPGLGVVPIRGSVVVDELEFPF
jgi:hypothetical protein